MPYLLKLYERTRWLCLVKVIQIRSNKQMIRFVCFNSRPKKKKSEVSENVKYCTIYFLAAKPKFLLQTKKKKKKLVHPTVKYTKS